MKRIRTIGDAASRREQQLTHAIRKAVLKKLENQLGALIVYQRAMSISEAEIRKSLLKISV